MKDAVEREQKAKADAEEAKRLKAVGAQMNDKKIRAVYKKEERDKMEQDRMRKLRFYKNEDKRQPLLGVEFKRLAKAKNFTELKKRWESTCSMDEEMNRLKVVKKEQSQRKVRTDEEEEHDNYKILKNTRTHIPFPLFNRRSPGTVPSQLLSTPWRSEPPSATTSRRIQKP